jgi:uncharacterized protein (DUF1778 family)
MTKKSDTNTRTYPLDRTIVLSSDEWDKLQELLKNPPEPSPALIKALKESKKRNGL